MGNRYRVEILRSQARVAFSCGVEALDRYLLRQASQDQRRRVAVVYLMVDSETQKVAGYYTLSTASIRSDKLPESLRARLPRYEELPAALIGRLALDIGYQGQRLGGFLVLDALQRCVTVGQQLGLLAVMVQAKDDRARAFYEAFEFRPFVGEQYRLYLPLDRIKSLSI